MRARKAGHRSSGAHNVPAHTGSHSPDLESLDFTTFPSLVNQAHGLYPFKHRALQAVRYAFGSYFTAQATTASQDLALGVQKDARSRYLLIHR